MMEFLGNVCAVLGVILFFKLGLGWTLGLVFGGEADDKGIDDSVHWDVVEQKFDVGRVPGKIYQDD